MRFHIDMSGESSLCRMRRVENKTVPHTVSECKMLVQKEYKKIKRGMAMQAGTFIENYTKNMALKEHNSRTSMSQMVLLRIKSGKFYGILKFIAIPRMKLGDQILSLLIKLRWKL